MFKNILIALFFPLMVWAQAPSEFQNLGNRNYLLNPDFEKGKTGWLFLGITPAFNTNIDNTGKQSLTYVTPASGWTVRQNVLVDANLANKNCSISINAKSTVESGDYITVIYGPNPGSMIEMNSNYRVTVPNTGVNTRRLVVASFPCPDAGNYVGIQITSTSSGNTVIYDNAYLGLAQFSEIPNVTSWTNYTPTITANSGTLTNYTLSNTAFMQVGENIFIKGKLTFTGSVGTWSRPRVSLPSGYIIDNGVYAVQSGVTFVDTGTNRYGSDVHLGAGTSFVEFNTYRGSNGVIVDPTQAAPFAWTSTDEMHWLVGPIKISNLANTATVVNAECRSASDCDNTVDADISTAGVITNDRYGFLASCTSFAPSVCTFKSGFFTVQPVCKAYSIGGTSASFAFEVTYSGTTSVSVDRKDELGSRRALAYTLECRKRGADYKPKQVIQGQVGETVAAAYWLPSNTSSSPINYSSKIYDTHNAVTTGASWKFTAPQSGLYSVSGGGYCTSGSNYAITVYKNASAYAVLSTCLYTNGVQSRGSISILLNAGDYIDMRLSSGTAVGNTQSNPDTNTIFITKVGN